MENINGPPQCLVNGDDIGISSDVWSGRCRAFDGQLFRNLLGFDFHFSVELKIRCIETLVQLEYEVPNLVETRYGSIPEAIPTIAFGLVQFLLYRSCNLASVRLVNSVGIP